MTERIVNRNPYLYGPGPIRRVPSGMGSYYGKLPPLQGFTMAVVHGTVISLVGGYAWKVLYGDPDAKALKQYYVDNPPR